MNMTNSESPSQINSLVICQPVRRIFFNKQSRQITKTYYENVE